ncbi:hypothetical protein L484_023762 [Morus notabilis]|uniref:Uncharacterized protein n=1 Tax=Morus notabilis TaxID=981085 RepID=W9R170_9ROSA|nr:hypothetical protein L484_023762 [Morus notabilis]
MPSLGTSPLLLVAGAVLVAAVAGFGVGAAAALTGLAAFGWISSELGVGTRFSGLIGAYGRRPIERKIDIL